MMQISPNFTATISVDQTPEEAFAGITNLRGCARHEFFLIAEAGANDEAQDGDA